MGLSIDGRVELGNGHEGIHVTEDSHHNVVGGIGGGNLVGSNGDAGIAVYGVENVVQVIFSRSLRSLW